MKAPIPTPTAEALAASKAEEDSRGSSGRFHRLMDNFHKHPDVNMAAHAGQPNLAEEEQTSAAAVIQQMNDEVKQAAGLTDKTTVETLKSGTGPTPGPNQPPPGSNSSNNSGSNNSTGATPAPPRANDIGAAADGSSQSSTQAGAQGTQQQSSDQQDSSSKKKKKKGLRKIIPF